MLFAGPVRHGFASQWWLTVNLWPLPRIAFTLPGAQCATIFILLLACNVSMKELQCNGKAWNWAMCLTQILLSVSFFFSYCLSTRCRSCIYLSEAGMSLLVGFLGGGQESSAIARSKCRVQQRKCRLCRLRTASPWGLLTLLVREDTSDSATREHKGDQIANYGANEKKTACESRGTTCHILCCSSIRIVFSSITTCLSQATDSLRRKSDSPWWVFQPRCTWSIWSLVEL